MNKAALFYVEQTVTAHIVLFYVWHKRFYCLVVHISCCISIFLVFCARWRPTSKQKREQRYITKRLASFIASLLLSTAAKAGGRFRPFIPRCSGTCLCTQLGRGVGFFTLLFKRNFSFFFCQIMKNLQWPSEKELILYKIFLNKEITDWQKYGRNTLGEGRGVVGIDLNLTIRISAVPIPGGWNAPH